MKKRFLFILVFALTLSVVACKKNNLKKDFLNSNFNLQKLLSAEVLNDTLNEPVEPTNPEEPVEPTEDEILINTYLTLFNSYKSRAQTTVTQEESDKLEYSVKYVVKFNTLTSSNDYVIYLNVTDIEEDDDEIEEELRGLVVIGELEYEVIGEREVEDDEVELELIIKLDSNNYILIKEEKEDDELELEYTIIKDGVKVLEFALEVEDDGEIKIVEKNNQSVQIYKLKEKNNMITINHFTNNEINTFIISKEADKFIIVDKKIEINKYSDIFNLVENFSEIDLIISLSDKEGYSNMISNENFNIYYNNVKKKKINGIIVFGNKTFDIKGEIKNDEIELTIKLDEKDSEIEIEIEDNKLEIEFELMDEKIFDIKYIVEITKNETNYLIKKK